MLYKREKLYLLIVGQVHTTIWFTKNGRTFFNNRFKADDFKACFATKESCYSSEFKLVGSDVVVKDSIRDCFEKDFFAAYAKPVTMINVLKDKKYFTKKELLLAEEKIDKKFILDAINHYIKNHVAPSAEQDTEEDNWQEEIKEKEIYNKDELYLVVVAQLGKVDRNIVEKNNDLFEKIEKHYKTGVGLQSYFATKAGVRDTDDFILVRNGFHVKNSIKECNNKYEIFAAYSRPMKTFDGVFADDKPISKNHLIELEDGFNRKNVEKRGKKNNSNNDKNKDTNDDKSL